MPGLFSTPRAPTPPDPVIMAQQQAQANKDAATTGIRLNRMNQYTPYGTTVYRDDPRQSQYLIDARRDIEDRYARGERGGPIADLLNKDGQLDETKMLTAIGKANPYAGAQEQFVTLSPTEQAKQDQSDQAQLLYGAASLEQLGKVRDRLATPFTLAGAPARTDTITAADPSQRVTGDGMAARSRAEEALYQRLEPRLGAQREALETRLRNQGLSPGSQAWSLAMRDQAQAETDARLGVTAQGGNEQMLQAGIERDTAGFNNAVTQQAMQNAISRAQFGNQARSQAIAETLQERGTPLNEAAALLTGQQVNYPQFGNYYTADVRPTDVIGANQVSSAVAQNNYNQAMQSRTSMLNGLFSLAGQGARFAAGGFGGADGGMKA